jgi:hypothetical protein
MSSVEYVHTRMPKHTHTLTHTHTHQSWCPYPAYATVSYHGGVYIRTYVHTYMHACMHTYIRTCMHTYIHTCMHACVHTCIHACTNTHTYTHTNTHTYTYYIHTYIHTYIYVGVSDLMSSSESYKWIWSLFRNIAGFFWQTLGLFSRSFPTLFSLFSNSDLMSASEYAAASSYKGGMRPARERVRKEAFNVSKQANDMSKEAYLEPYTSKLLLPPHMYMCIYICICIYKYICLQAHTHMCVYIYTCTYIIHTSARAHTHKHTHTLIQTNKQTHIPAAATRTHTHPPTYPPTFPHIPAAATADKGDTDAGMDRGMGIAGGVGGVQHAFVLLFCSSVCG